MSKIENGIEAKLVWQTHCHDIMLCMAETTATFCDTLDPRNWMRINLQIMILKQHIAT